MKLIIKKGMNMLKVLGRKTHTLLSRIIIIGPLFNCGLDEHLRSQKEFWISLGFATVTFWFSALILLALKSNADKSYLDMLTSTVQSGELFIFSVGFMGAIILTALEDPDNAKPFPGKTWHLAILTFLALIAAGFFSLMRVLEPADQTLIFDRQFIFKTSVVIAVISIIFRYLTIVYRKETLKVDMKDQETSFKSMYAAHLEELEDEE